MRFPFVAALVLVSACAEYEMADSNDSDDRSDSAGIDTNFDSDDEAPVEPAQYWSLDGVLVVTDGVLDVDASRFFVDLWLDGSSVCGATPATDTGLDTDTSDDTGVDADVLPTEPDVDFASTTL